MAENKSRGLFVLDGITGMLIATGLLLGILFVLTSMAINIQQREATHYYDPSPIVNSLDNVKMISKENKKYDISNL
ncbi:MAG: DUF4006 family protein [Epsilonproteobacteria bacterium]|nr:DUF4006 family protein [Campylobacterota bacterium]